MKRKPEKPGQVAGRMAALRERHKKAGQHNEEETMSNMSYCRFQNTADDLQDCLDNLRTLSPDDNSFNAVQEKQSRRRLINAAALMLAELGVEDPEDALAVDARIDELDDNEYQP